MTITFFGHGKNEYSTEVKNKLMEEVENLIQNGADEFLMGGYGKFDTLAAQVIAKLKIKYSYIRSVLIIPYLNHSYDMNLYDSTLYPDLENIFPKAAILERNKWMVEKADVVICYVRYTVGGANKAMQYAKKNNKIVINMADFCL